MTADTLDALIEARAGDDRPGLLYEDRVWSWREYVQECRSRAAWLDARAQGRGLHVGVLLDNVPELVFLIGAAALSAHVLVALNSTRSVDDLVADAAATDVDLIVYGDAHADLAQRVASGRGVEALDATELRAEAGELSSSGELVMLIFTSGTSGRPRAVRVTQRKIGIPGTSLAAMLTPDDVVYCAMPLFHSSAIMAAYAPAVASGASLVLRRRFSASGLLPDLRRYGCTYLNYVGKALSYVLATPAQADDADNPLKIAFGNEGGSTATKRFGERFGCYVIDAFGSTETAISITPALSGPPGCLGTLPDGIEIRDRATGRLCAPAILDQGRLLNPDEAIGELVNVAGLGLFEGYYQDQAADDERIRDGAFWSGDLAYADPNGYVFFAGRGTERLRVDGENLAVAPIEAAIREFTGVIEAAVYPVPDAAAGDQVMAALVLEGAFDPKAFADFLGGRTDLGAKAIPRYIRISEELPQTPSHKVIKRFLAKEAWRTSDPVWWRRTQGFTPLGEQDIKGIEDEFIRHGRHHLLEG